MPHKLHQNGITPKEIKRDTPEWEEAGLDNRNVRQYEYTNSNGEKVSIREDKPVNYNNAPSGNQGNHFNAGETGNKLKQHHTFEKKNQ